MNNAFFAASFANCKDLGTQLRYILLMNDSTKLVSSLCNASYKCWGIVRAVLGGETYTMANCFGAVFMIEISLKTLLV